MSQSDKDHETWSVRVCCWLARKGEDSSCWCAETADSWNFGASPACRNSVQVSVQHIAVKVAIEMPEEHCTSDETGRWWLGLGRLHCTMGGL